MNHWVPMLVLLPAAVTVIMLSSFSEAEPSRTTICSTAKSNGSQANCTVPYKNTELVLSCDHSNDWANQTSGGVVGGGPYWMKGGCSISGGQDLGHSINYTVNHNRRLTNSDSAIYCCTWNSLMPEFEYSYSIDINVHAPPQLNNVHSCKGIDRSNCTVGEKQLPYYPVDADFPLVVYFTGNGPFSVQWFHNGTEFSCLNPTIGCAVNESNNSQTLTRRRFSIEDAWKISGSYTAIVSNPYGSNSSTVQVRYDHCVPSAPVHHDQKIQTTILDLTKGMNLNYSFCELIGPKNIDMVVCLTRNKSDKLEQLFHHTPGNCVQFTNGECIIPCNNSITRMQVSIFEASSDKCSPSRLIRFAKKHVSLRDDGIVILSGYWIESSIKQYCSIYLRVNSNPWPRYYVWVPVVVVIIAIIMLVIVFVYRRYCKGHCGSRSRGSTGGLTDSWDEHRSVLIQDGTDRLLEFEGLDNSASEPAEPYFIPDHYGSMSVLEVFPHEFDSQGSVQNVTIPAL